MAGFSHMLHANAGDFVLILSLFINDAILIIVSLLLS